MFNWKYEIEETRRINNIKFPEGDKSFYFSKLTLVISLLKNITFLILGIYFLIQIDFISILGLFLIIVFTVSIINDILPRLLYEKPLFIFYNNSLYCTKNNLVYDLMDTSVMKFKGFKQYFTTQIRIQSLDRTRVFNEELFWIKGSEELKKTICEKQGIRSIPWSHRYL